ncbi:hypothetical protein [Hyphomicrobium sp. DY-1]|uniref:hypothetical protein n=1 Tax=Hyphomicrobium sp. DY-1 TaxID=3075650 RepID=UPI0039C1C541
MATRQWSLTDHVSVENGSPTVTAEAAVWLVTAKPGNGISFDGGSKYYEILTVDSNTQITLADDFAETTISDGSVLIDNRGNGYTPAEVEVIQLYKDVVLNQIDLFQTTGKPPDTRGGDGSIGWDGPNRVWYQKTNGVWGDPQNLGGADGMDAGFKFEIDKSSISMADPGAGKFRLNNAASASVTQIAFDDISADFGSPDVSAYLATWAQSTNTVKGHLIFHEVGATQNFLVYAITSLVDNAGWTQVNVSHVASGGSIDDGDELAIAFIRTGDKGDPGVQAGFRFKFATMTGMVDPGTGFLRFNSNTYATITAVAISDLCAATGNPDVSASILSWDNSGNTENKGVLRIAKQDAEQTFIELAIVGATVDNTGWSQLAVEYLSGNGTFATNDQIVVTFYRTGDDGWSPVFSIVEDGDRRVLEVTDWTGGIGTKPAINKYVGDTGFVDDITDGVDIRGPIGQQGEGLEPDSRGAFAERADHDSEDTNYCYLSIDGDGDQITTACLFFKLSAESGDWSDPTILGTSGSGSSSSSRNRIINPTFAIAQAGVGSVLDCGYSGIDQWHVYTQTGAVASSLLTNVADGVPSMGRLTQSQATAQRMGWAQLLESSFVKDLRSKTVSLSAVVRLSVPTKLRYAIIEWTGAADTLADIVNSWTNTTFTSGQFFAASNLTIAEIGSIDLAASTLTDVSLSASISSAMNNIVIFFWTDSAQAQNVTFDISNVFFGQGASAPTVFDPPAKDIELIRCWRHYWKLMPAAANEGVSSGFVGSSTNVNYLVPYPIPMRDVPNWDGGSAADWRVSTAGVGTSGSSYGASTFIGKSTARIQVTVSGGMTSGYAALLYSLNTASYMAFDARMALT